MEIRTSRSSRLNEEDDKNIQKVGYRNIMGFFRQIFGPSQKEIWQKLSVELGASYIDKGVWHSDQVVNRVGNWTITLDTFTVSTGKSTIVYTRLRAPFRSREGLRLKIYRRGFFSRFGTFFGLPPVEAGIPELTQCFVVKGDHPRIIQELLADPRI